MSAPTAKLNPDGNKRKLAAYITRTVAAAPPLTRQQADELAVLFRPPPGGASR